jgi:hypothetical protein
MRYYFILLIGLMMACNQEGKQINGLQAKIDSLQYRLNMSYKPGFGEFMSDIQMHHAKLWFAGINQNWPLADFEMNEIKESIDGIKQYCQDRTETKAITMINPAMDSLSNAITHMNTGLFKSSFVLLTKTCNNCHLATEHAFNMVTIPTSPPVVNQDFKPH